ncbi:nuclear RNA export factor 2 isoform X1 [Anopheles coustani]|uniref:nuclear RNA export factor 2 isoform X1 n=1 Tax=Anopheles coustani TaxID=139045 RepID=UPI002658BE59|nr:nuclear RNA export factor 2 isoform X1 [Anopheles coustani]
MQEGTEDNPMRSTPISADQAIPEHDENSFYNIKSNARQTLYMRTGETKIVLEPKLASQVTNASNMTFDRVMLNRADVWHQVMIHHDGQCEKQKILDMLFNTFPLYDLFPVAYRRHANIDFFLVRMCPQAIGKLFDDGLKLKFGQLELAVSIRLGAAKFQTGQIFPRSMIAEAVQERCKNAQLYGMVNVLNLDNFAAHPQLEELCISLSNRSQFEVVCSAISQCLSSTARINNLRLANNRIFHTTPLSALKNSHLVCLDVSDNRIKHPSALRTLREIPLLELYVKGNPLTDVPDYEETLREFFPSLLKLDALVTVSTTIPADVNSDDEEEVEMSSPGVVLTDADLNAAAFKKYQMTPHWHLVTVHHNGICGKQEILDALFHQLGKLSFFPCYYKTYSKKDEFLVQNCYEALLYLVQQQLKLPVPSVNAVLKLSVAMNVAEAADNHVRPLRKLDDFVNKRFEENCLNLCSMQEGLNEYKYVDFSAKSPRILGYILEVAGKKFSHSCFILRLRNNDLQNCDALGNIGKLTRLVSLDLRFNSLSTITDLNGIPRNFIEELFLDHNPLCGTISSGVEYTRKIRRYFHNLKRLDGRPLVTDRGFTFQQNYICTMEAHKFAEAFLKHYFSLYDSFQRLELQELYHPKAQFSMTCSFDVDESAQLNSHQQRQVSYIGHSRNLLEFKGRLDLSFAALIVGNERIAYVLTTFPKTEFDFLSFRIDVPIFTPERVLIIVHGRLKEESEARLGESCSLGFTRTFYIQPCGMGTGLFSKAVEYKICNDMLHLCNLTFEGQNFLDTRAAEAKETSSTAELTPLEGDDRNDRENALTIFKQLTQLNQQWCVRCLEESSWNLMLAMNIFLKLYESGHIPKLAFTDSG